MSSSISRQLVLWLAVPLMLLALCGALVHYFNTVAPGVASSDKRLKSAANALMARIQVHDGVVTLDDATNTRVNADTTATPEPITNVDANAPTTGASNAPASVTPEAAQSPAAGDGMLYAVRDGRGRLLAGNDKVPAVTLNSDTPQTFAMLQVDRHAVRSLTTRLDTPAGGVLVTVADTRPLPEPAARYGFVSTLLWDFVQLDVTLVLVWVGIRLGLRPLKRLRDDIAARSPQDLRPIEETSAPREIAPVVVTLNRLFNTLRTSAQSQQQFIANTAHQLRTPITGLQAQLDLLLAEPAAQPVSHRLRTLQEGIKQLAHASNQLLTLARADPSVNLATKKREVRLDATVAEVAARYFDHALRSNLDLGVDTQPVTVLADPALLDDLLSNLVDNALKYTPPGGSVTLRAGQQLGRPFLAVEDTGPGIPEAEHQRVRQRFYRLPNSPGHGSGLGLAIVDEIARLHDATLTIGAGADGGGTVVTLRFG